MIQTILLATDGSSDSAKAEAYALHLALTGQAVLTVLYVGDDRLCHYGEVDQLVTETTKKQFISYVQSENAADCRRALQAFAGRAQEAGVSYDTSIRTGDPAVEIVAEAREKESDLLIIGGGGHTECVFNRSSGICSKVLKHSPCPVLITK